MIDRENESYTHALRIVQILYEVCDDGEDINSILKNVDTILSTAPKGFCEGYLGYHQPCLEAQGIS